jgi:hypothetical protein
MSKPTLVWVKPGKASTQVAEIGYCAATKTLGVRFHNGGEYHYHNVTQEHYDTFLAAESAGKHLGAHIKGKHTYTKIGKDSE